MKKVKITTIFFFIGCFIFSSQLKSQSSNRIKLLDATFVLLNGDSVKINTLDNTLFKEINQQIEVTCKRNLQIAIAAKNKQPAKSFYFLKNALLLDSTYLPAHAALIDLYLFKKDTISAIKAANNAYKQTKSKKLIPIITVLNKGSEKIELQTGKETLTGSTAAKLNYIKGLAYYQDKNYTAAATAFEKGKTYTYAPLSSGISNLLFTDKTLGKTQLQSLLKDTLLHNLAAYHLAIAAYQENEFETGLKYINQILQQDTAMVQAYFIRAHLYHQIGKSEKALSDFKVCMENKYRYNEAAINAAVCLYGLALYEEADKTASLVIENTTDIAMAHLVRGNAKEMKQDFLGACEDWYKAIDLGMTEILPLITNFCKANSEVK